jgi:hypothetical protein
MIGLINFIQWVYAHLCALIGYNIYSEQWMLNAIACENHWLIDKQAKYVYKHGCGHMWVYRTASHEVINMPAVLELLYLAPSDLMNDLKDRFNNVNEIATSSKRMVLQTARVGQFHYGNKPLTVPNEVNDEAIEYCDKGFDKSRYWVKDFAKTAKELVADGTLPRIDRNDTSARNLHWRDCMYNNS